MVFDRLPAKDPRTVARDIPGIFDALFPQLVQGVVASFNREARSLPEIEPLPDELVKRSRLSHSMLFEIAYARAEQMLRGPGNLNWDKCLEQAVERQRRHYDAKIPAAITENDRVIADHVAQNLTTMLLHLKEQYDTHTLTQSPQIPGYQWIASGYGDFALGPNLIEVKCTGKHFSSSDYRQIIMYWLLSYLHATEHQTVSWTHAVLLNPRLNNILELPFDDMIAVTGAGRSKIDLIEQFSNIVGEHTLRMIASH